MGGDQDRIAEKADPALFGQPFEPRLLGHEVVEDHHVVGILVEQPRGLAPVLGHVDARAVVDEDLRQEVAHARPFVDDEDRRLPKLVAEASLRSHRLRPLLERGGAAGDHGHDHVPPPRGGADGGGRARVDGLREYFRTAASITRPMPDRSDTLTRSRELE